MHIPYALQLAHGWTKLAFYQNVIAVVVLVPAIYLATLRWGAVGAAGVWIVLNSGYLLIGIHVMYRRLLIAEKLHWYVNDIAKPLLATLVVVWVGRMMMISDTGDFQKIVTLLVVFGLATIGAAISAETLRNKLKLCIA